MGEKTYYSGLVPLIVKGQAGTFSGDGLQKVKDIFFNSKLLPLRTDTSEAASQGVTTPKPDFVYSLKAPLYPGSDAPILKAETEAEIGVARGTRHAFFSIDKKSAQQSIEAAENQAMRAGATMVKARRFLNRKAAKGKAGPIIRQDPATNTSDTDATDDTAMSDPFVAREIF